MKKMSGIIGVLFFFMMAGAACAGLFNFSKMSNEELFQFRQEIQGASAEDQAAYQAEWEKRVKTMTAEEKGKYIEKPREDEKIQWLYSPGQGYEGPITEGRAIYGSPTLPVVTQPHYYGAPAQNKDDRQQEKGDKQGKDNKEEQKK